MIIPQVNLLPSVDCNSILNSAFKKEYFMPISRCISSANHFVFLLIMGDRKALQ